MKYIAALFCLIISCALSEGRPSMDGRKRKYPPPEAGFTSRDPETNMTMDELIASQLGDLSEEPSKIMAGGLIRTELDLFLTPQQFAAFHPHESDLLPISTSRKRRKAQRDTVYRWFHAEIPYVIEENSFSDKDEYGVQEAMTEWERYTCVRFRPATPSHANHVNIVNGQACSSQLGMVRGKQELQLNSPGCRYRGLYIHEIGHTLGLIHEHQRPDRDNHIDVITGNVAPSLIPQFYKYTLEKVDLVDTTYEYSSIMHYGVKAFSYNGKAQTIRTKDPAREEEIGKVYLKELSFNDIKAVNNMYNCSSDCSDTIRCTNGGFVDPTCRCVCPDGSRDCEEGREKPASDDTCSNEYDDWQCFIWANSGQCHRNRKFMSTSCRKSCGLCGAASSTDDMCKDLYSSRKCEGWKSRGECVANEDWMNRHCRKTCNACVDKDQRPETNCDNKHDSDTECQQWTGEGECVINRYWMHNNCQKSCSYCDKTPPVIETSGECKDTYYDKSSCSDWADKGECDANPDWMLIKCRKSCGRCGGGVVPKETACEDTHETCAQWAEEGECLKNPDWMLDNCKISCDNCDSTRPTSSPGGASTPPPTGPCKNDHTSNRDCEVWAQAGHCDINPGFMHDMCRKACKLCDDGDNSGTTDDCEDIYSDKASCAQWASVGECEANPIWMLVNCQKSCGRCTKQPTTDTNRKCNSSGVRQSHNILLLGIVYVVMTMMMRLL